MKQKTKRLAPGYSRKGITPQYSTDPAIVSGRTQIQRGFPERCFTLDLVSEMTGYSVAALRRKVANRKITYRRSARLILIPQSEIVKIQGDLYPAVDGPSAR